MSGRPVLVIGASGAVGGYVARCLAAHRPTVGTRLRRTDNAGYRALDATSPEQVRAALDSVRPGAVLIAAALADVDRCQREPRLSLAANVRLPEVVSQECARRGIFVVHLSTDYVFDGRGGPYAEDDATEPVNVYGLHKREGEHVVLDSGAASAVLRTCVVYGGDRPGAAESVAAALRDERTVRLSGTHVNTPTHVADLAWAVRAVIDREATGLFHTGGPEPMSRLEFGRAVARVLAIDPRHVVPADSAPDDGRAPRPERCGLRVDRAATILGYRPRPVAEGLAALFGEG